MNYVANQITCISAINSSPSRVVPQHLWAHSVLISKFLTYTNLNQPLFKSHYKLAAVKLDILPQRRGFFKGSLVVRESTICLTAKTTLAIRIVTK